MEKLSKETPRPGISLKTTEGATAITINSRRRSVAIWSVKMNDNNAFTVPL